MDLNAFLTDFLVRFFNQFIRDIFWISVSLFLNVSLIIYDTLEKEEWNFTKTLFSQV